jgi:CRP/FNR family cyclic AMP-dependent transcriptional regulator
MGLYRKTLSTFGHSMKNLTAEQLALVSANPCLTQIDSGVQHAITQSIYIKRLQKGQFLHRRGDLAVGYYGVVSGRLRVSAENREGKALTLTFMQSGDWFGEISLVDGVPRTHDCEALETCEVLIIPKASFEQNLLQDTKSLRHITQHICQRLRLVLNLVEQMSIQSLHERLARRLLDLAKIDGNTLNINQQELAQMMGVSRQSVSKILLGWAQEKWIKLEYNHLYIQQPDQLMALCITDPVPQLAAN